MKQATNPIEYAAQNRRIGPASLPTKTDDFEGELRNRRIRRPTPMGSLTKTNNIAYTFNEFGGTLRRVRRSKPIYSPSESANEEQ